MPPAVFSGGLKRALFVCRIDLSYLSNPFAGYRVLLFDEINIVTVDPAGSIFEFAGHLVAIAYPDESSALFNFVAIFVFHLVPPDLYVPEKAS